MADGPKELLANIAPFGLRLQPELKERIKEAAELHGRSMNAEIVAILEEYPRLAMLPMDVSYLKMENEQLAAKLEATKDALEDQRKISAGLQQLLSENFSDAQAKNAADQETFEAIQTRYDALQEQAEYLERLKAELLSQSKEPAEKVVISDQPMTSELFDKLFDHLIRLEKKIDEKLEK